MQVLNVLKMQHWLRKKNCCKIVLDCKYNILLIYILNIKGEISNMNLFKSESLYDSDNGKWIEKYWINEEEVDGDLYFYKLDREKDIEDKNLKEELESQSQETMNICHQYCEGICESCCGECGNEYEDKQEVDYDELLDIFAEKIQNTGGCPECIKEILDDFADIVLEANDEEYCDDDDCGDCNECVCNQEEFTDQQIEEIKMIESFAYRIENVNCDCGCEMRNLLYELFSIGKNVGWNDHRDYMKELMKEALEE